jgi:hypothetical protein
VMFADFFRQLVAPESDEGGIFAGVQVQTLPFFTEISYFPSSQLNCTLKLFNIVKESV